MYLRPASSGGPMPGHGGGGGGAEGTGPTPSGGWEQWEEVGLPDPAAGLYIRARDGTEVKAVLPKDCVGFQVGETWQVHSGGKLRATPHAVSQSRAPHPLGGLVEVEGACKQEWADRERPGPVLYI